MRDDLEAQARAHIEKIAHILTGRVDIESLLPADGRAEVVEGQHGRAREGAGLVVLLERVDRTHDLGRSKNAAGEDVRRVGHRSQIAGSANDRSGEFGVLGEVLGNEVVVVDKDVRPTGGARANASLARHAHADGVEAEAARGADGEVHDGGGDFNDPNGHIQSLDGGFVGGHVFADVAHDNGIPADIGHDRGLVRRVGAWDAGAACGVEGSACLLDLRRRRLRCWLLGTRRLAGGAGVKAEARGFRRLLGAECSDHRAGFSSSGEGFRDQPAAELAALGDEFVEERGHAFDHRARTASGARGIGGIAAEDDVVGPGVIERENLDHHFALLVELLLVIHRLRDVLGDIDKRRQARDRKDRAALDGVEGRAGGEDTERVQRVEHGVGFREAERHERRLHLHRRADIEDAIVEHPHEIE